MKPIKSMVAGLLGLVMLSGTVWAGNIVLGDNFDEHNLVDKAKVSLDKLAKASLKKVKGKVVWVGYFNNQGVLAAASDVIRKDGGESKLDLDPSNGKVLAVKDVDLKKKAEEEAAEAKADAEKAAKDPKSEEARKAADKAKGEAKPGPSANSSVSVAPDASVVETAKSAKLSMRDAMKAALKNHPGKLNSAYLSHDARGKVFYGIVVKHEDGSMTLVYVDPVTGKVLGTEMGG